MLSHGKEEELLAVDSFDQINFSNDNNLQEINLQRAKDLQNRLTSNLKGLNNHYQFLSSNSQERKNTSKLNYQLFTPTNQDTQHNHHHLHLYQTE